MYCKKCGKQIDTNEDYCFECQRDNLIFGSQIQQPGTEETKQEAPVQTTVVPVQTQPSAQNYQTALQPSYSKKFGRALASTIIGVIAYILGFCAFIFAYFKIGDSIFSDILNCSYDFDTFSDVAEVFYTFSKGFTVVSAIMAVIGLVFGICSISHFKKIKKSYGVKIVPTLVLGIVGTVWSGLTLYFNFMTVIVIKMTAFL